MRFHYYHYVWIAVLVGWFSNYMTRVALSPVLTLIRSDLGLNYTELGVLASIYFYAYMAMQIPAGTLGDRFGRKRLLVSSTALWGVFSAAMAYANSFFSISALRFLKGLAHGVYFSNDRPVIARVTPREKIGTGYSLSFLGIVGGSFLGVLLGGLIGEVAGWRMVFLTFSATSIAGVILLLKFLKRDDVGQRGETKQSRVKFSSVLKNRELWLLCVAGIPLVYNFWLLNTWGPTVLQEVLSVGVAEASAYASLFSLAGAVGMFTFGKLSDLAIAKKGNTKPILLLNCSSLALIILLSAFALVAEGGLIVALFAISGFFMWSVWTPMYVLVSDIAPEEVRGTAFGVLNAIHLIGGIAAPWVTGWLRDITGSFSASFALAGALLVVALLLVALIKPENKIKL